MAKIIGTIVVILIGFFVLRGIFYNATWPDSIVLECMTGDPATNSSLDACKKLTYVPESSFSSKAEFLATRCGAYGRLINAKKIDVDEGLAACDQAVKDSPSSADAHNFRGLAYSYKGYNEIAIAEFTEAIKIAPNSNFYYNRASIFKREGLTDKAKDDFALEMQSQTK